MLIVYSEPAHHAAPNQARHSTEQFVYYERLLSIIRCTIITTIPPHIRADVCSTPSFVGGDRCATTCSTRFYVMQT